ncbi:MAG: hydroxymethylbilane synthase [Bosea sp. (in: a-proteobacteria)]
MDRLTDALLTIGTRGSPLALAQARMTAEGLAGHWAPAKASGGDGIAITIIKTSGDRIQDRALSEAGGKGLFTKEIDEAQLAGEIDLAVHSAKDLPTELPEGLVIAGYLPREDVRDALITRHEGALAGLPHAARIGSASLRRRAQLLRLRPDLVPELLRGNVATRISRVREGALDATLLAVAGLKRLGLAHEVYATLDLEAFLPAVGQGAIALVTRADDARAMEAVNHITCAVTGHALAAERAFLGVLDGSCRTPIAGHAWIENGVLHLKGEVLTPDGKAFVAGTRHGPLVDATRMGRDLGHELKAIAPAGALG